MSTTPNASAAAATASAKDRLDAAQRELISLRSGINRNTSITVAVGALLLLVLAGYFYYLTRLWAEFTEPEGLVNLAQTMIDDKLPATREKLAQQIIKSGPSWAVGLSQEFIKSIPDGRKQLETFAISQLEESVKEADLMTETEFRKFLRKNKPMLEQRFKELAASPKLADQAFKDLLDALEEDLQADFKTDAAELLKTLKEANENWKSLIVGVDLTEEGALERRVWALGRRIHLELTDPIQLQRFDAEAAKQPPKKTEPKSKTKSKANTK